MDQRPIPIKKPLPEQKPSDNAVGITTTTWMLMIGVALFFDTSEALISLVPILGEILSVLLDIFVFATFWLWFKIKGEKYSRSTMIGGFIIGLVPIINILPEATLTIVLLYFSAKAKKAANVVPGGNAFLKTGLKQKGQFENKVEEIKSGTSYSKPEVKDKNPLRMAPETIRNSSGGHSRPSWVRGPDDKSGGKSRPDWVRDPKEPKRENPLRLASEINEKM